MEKNYFFQEIISLEPKRKTIKFLINYSKSIKSVRVNDKTTLINLN